MRATSAGGNATYCASVSPATADYRVEADIILKGATDDDQIAGVVGRLDTAGTSAGTFYTARYSRSAAAWELRKAVNGSGVVVLTSSTCSGRPPSATRCWTPTAASPSAPPCR